MPYVEHMSATSLLYARERSNTSSSRYRAYTITPTSVFTMIRTRTYQYMEYTNTCIILNFEVDAFSSERVAFGATESRPLREERPLDAGH